LSVNTLNGNNLNGWLFDVSSFPGPDYGAQLAACTAMVDTLPATAPPGICDARNMPQGPAPTISENVECGRVHSCQILLPPSGSIQVRRTTK
jgi:hypothetical protein